MLNKNNWRELKMSKQQIKAAKIVNNQKMLTAEELIAEGDKAYEDMQKRKAYEKARSIKLK